MTLTNRYLRYTMRTMIEKQPGWFSRNFRGRKRNAIVATSAPAQPPPAPRAPEVDPLGEFKKSNAYEVLLHTERIDRECKIIAPYFRVELVESSVQCRIQASGHLQFQGRD